MGSRYNRMQDMFNTNDYYPNSSMGTGGMGTAGMSGNGLIVTIASSFLVAILIMCIFFPDLFPFELPWQKNKKQK